MKNRPKRKAGVLNPRKTRTSGWSGAAPRRRKKASPVRAGARRPGPVSRLMASIRRAGEEFRDALARRAGTVLGGAVVLWLVFLSGLLSDFTGSPGLLQAWRLRGLLEQRQAQLGRLETELAETRRQRERFRSSPAAQEAEIRRVLGYAAEDEIIFDFSSVSRQETATSGESSE